MGGHAPAGPVPHGVRPHCVDRDTGPVDDEKPQTGDRQHPLQELERDPPVRLSLATVAGLTSTALAISR